MRTFKPVRRSFFAPAADVVAPALLGAWLVRNTPAGPCGGRIVETEAYLAGDPACHAFGGQTARNRVMWGPPGYAYVYFIYGNHFCVNAVCQREGLAEAVLIRAVEATLNLDWMLSRRPVKAIRELTNGPGKLCQAMDISRLQDGADLCDAASPVFIARDRQESRFRQSTGPVAASTRVGITKAAERPLRFYLSGSLFVSRK